jgi:hypothetical protein
MLEVLKKVCDKLAAAQIPYMISGSLAVNVYTTPRMTRDIDIVVALKEEDVSTFVTLFESGFYCDASDIKSEVFRKGMFNLIDLQTITTIDFIVKKDSEYRNIEFERKQKSDVYGFEVYVVSVEDLILSKLEWIQVYQSDRQILDIMNLLEVSTLDKEYIRHWINILKLKTFDLAI